jgi:hypothetical protein
LPVQAVLHGNKYRNVVLTGRIMSGPTVLPASQPPDPAGAVVARRHRGFPEPVTVECWHLQNGTTNLDLPEISAKAKMQNETAARNWVKAFYQAAADAGLGRPPPSESKTRIVMDFFKPVT